MSEKKWNIDKNLGTQADTYIEKKFEEACERFPNGKKVLNEWRKRKEQYISYTDLVVIDYQHYSRHDVSHSIRILEAIELILGVERVNELGAGDLWLLLETAYFHDIGMAVTYDDLVKLWGSSDFQKFLQSPAVQADSDLKESRDWYIQMNNLVHDRDKLFSIEKEEEIAFEKTWPVELERKLLFLITAYIRKDHAKRCKAYLKKFASCSGGAIPDRLYQIVAEVTMSHSESFSYLLCNLKRKSQGLGMDYIHPQFVAALFRLGDLLDMDNNRFNLRAMEHYGPIPWTSLLHLKKHKAMTHILISHNRIEAESENEDLDVCRITKNWFDYIEQDVTELICCWSMIAPDEMKGCLMQKAVCKVYHPKAPVEFETDWQRSFEVDKAKLTDLLIGTNIYDTKMEFLREYIQNALDASKMQLWLDLKAGKYKYQCNPGIYSMEQLAPFDIPQEIYDQYLIDVRIDWNEEQQKVKLEIVDQGIGMEEACLDAISKIGMGWRGRKQYNEEIPVMLPWLRPTGGFGIGIQSAFMLADQVELLTKSDSELESHRLILNSPKESGTITVEKGIGLCRRGTTVIINLDLDYFQKWNEEYIRQSKEEVQKGEMTIHDILKQYYYSGDDIFSLQSALDYVIRYMEGYLREIIADSFIPIRITNPNRKPILLRSKYMNICSYWENEQEFKYGVETLDGRTYRWIYSVNNNTLSIWQTKEAVYTNLKYTADPVNRRHITCFKNVCVVRDTNFSYPMASDFEICIDFMGHSAESALKVHRNAFNENFSQKKYIENAINVFTVVMPLLKRKFASAQDTATENVTRNLYQSKAMLISLLYHDHDMKIPDDINKKIETVKYSVPITEASEHGQASSELKKNSHHIDMGTFLIQVQKLLIGESEESILVRCPIKRREKQKTINRKIIQTKLNDNSNVGSTALNIEFQEEFRIIDRMMRDDGMEVIDDENIFSILEESHQFDIAFFLFGETDSGDNIAEFKRKEKPSFGNRLEEVEFYKTAYGVSGRKWFGMPDSANYEKLLVSKLPYNVAATTTGPYLISPINQEIRMKYGAAIHTTANLSKKIYPYEKFRELVLDDGEFYTVLEWVYQNQVIEKKYTRNELKEEYQNFISDIYTKYLYREEKEDEL